MIRTLPLRPKAHVCGQASSFPFRPATGFLAVPPAVGQDRSQGYWPVRHRGRVVVGPAFGTAQRAYGRETPSAPTQGASSPDDQSMSTEESHRGRIVQRLKVWTLEKRLLLLQLTHLYPPLRPVSENMILVLQLLLIPLEV